MQEVAEKLERITITLETNIMAVEIALVSAIVDNLSESAVTDEGVRHTSCTYQSN